MAKYSRSVLQAVLTVHEVEETLSNLYGLLEFLYPLGLCPDSYTHFLNHIEEIETLKKEILKSNSAKPLEGFPAEIVEALEKVSKAEVINALKGIYE